LCDQQTGAADEAVGAVGLQLADLEGGERPGLDESVEPDGVESGEVAGEATDMAATAPEIAFRAESQRQEAFAERRRKRLDGGHNCPDW
jgi:hypothetical protein